jgi:hypothetical protein
MMMSDDWQPIETAPKDGRQVLLFSPGSIPEVVVGKWETYEGDPGEAWWAYAETALSDLFGEVDPEPSHWMPLPPPPANRPEEKG